MKPHSVGKAHRTPLTNCLNCGEPCDGASAIDSNASPSPGDATVCIYCGHLMLFDEGLSLRNPTDEEIKILAGDERIVVINVARSQLKAVHD